MPFLYESVTLVREDSVRQFCNSVQNDSSLGLLVKSFSIASSATPKDEASCHIDFLAGINYALMGMVTLTDLSIRLIEQPPYQQRHWYAVSFIFASRSHINPKMNFALLLRHLIGFSQARPSSFGA